MIIRKFWKQGSGNFFSLSKGFHMKKKVGNTGLSAKPEDSYPRGRKFKPWYHSQDIK